MSNFEVKIPSELIRDFVSAASSVIRETIFKIQTAMLISFTGLKTGRFYRVSKTGKLHQASAPGEAPAVETGNLSNTVAQGVSFPSPTEGLISINAEYAALLEFGTLRMAARPYVTPAIRGVLDDLARGGALD